ncbi:ubiquinone/menaquinone biosynthesis methyltransferase [candidate division KSB1 bacterium]
MSKGIKKIFSEVPDTYEMVNHVLTLGFDMIWRRKAARIAAEDGGNLWMDICSGTGEMAANLNRLADNGMIIVSGDFSVPMQSKAKEKKENKNTIFTITDAKELPFPDNTFDLITISFATRNLNLSKDILTKTFAEFKRVLKPGGRFINLETSQPGSKWIRKLVHLYVKTAVKPVGLFISGSKAGYTYLSSTIPRFYNGEELSEILYKSGFSKVVHKRLLFGVAAVHKAVK